MAEKVKMKAKKRFLNNGRILQIGEVFAVSKDVVNQYELNELAVPLSEAKEESEYEKYEDKTVKELKELAETLNIDGYKTMKKKQLIQSIIMNESERG